MRNSEAKLRVTDGPAYWTQKGPDSKGKHRTRRATVKRPRSSALWIIAAILLATDAGLGQQQADGDENGRESLEVPLLRAVPVPAGERIDLNGFLAEAAWSAAAPTTTFTQQEPTEGARPTEASEVRVVIDGDALYIGAMFFDDPDGVLAYQKRRDEGPWHRRPVYVDPRYLLGRTDRLLLRDQSGGPDGRRSSKRRRQRQQGLGRCVGGTSPTPRRWVVSRDSYTVEHPQLRSRVGHVGNQLSTDHPPQTGRSPLDRASTNRGAVSPHPRRAPDRSSEHVARYWSRGKAVRRCRVDGSNDAVVGLLSRCGSRPCLLHHPKPPGGRIP